MAPFRNDDYDKNIELFNYEDLSLYKKDNGCSYELSLSNSSLIIHKEASDINYCAFNLDKFSPVSHTSTKFRFTFVGSGSNAEIQVRFIESSYEIWAFSFIDDTIGEVTKEVSLDKLSITYNPVNNVFNYQSIMQVGLLIKTNNEVTIAVKEARFT